jgi:Asp-tRNA(Asn)/Glu-tRNA(Gln) amidotransferase A subunit family amidase
MRMVFAELASVHKHWFAQYGSLYRSKTAAAIQEGQAVGPKELEIARAGRLLLREKLASLMEQEGIDVWVSPAAPGPAPEGISTTGNSIMNLPWTYAGLPAITIPADHAANGLPLGLQCVGRFMDDERIIAWAEPLEQILKTI